MHIKLVTAVSVALYFSAFLAHIKNKSGPGQPNGSGTVMANLAPIQSNQDSTMHNSGSARNNFKIDLRSRDGVGPTYHYNNGALRTTVKDGRGIVTKVTY